MRCVLCSGPMRPLLSARDYRRPADPTEYVLNWCYNCEFGRLDGEFTSDVVRDFYNIDYYTHVPIGAWSAKPAPEAESFWDRLRCHLAWRVDRSLDFSAQELGEPRGRKVCDIGCGNGSKIEALTNAGFQVTGIEPDPTARSLAAKSADVFDGTAERLPYQLEGQHFDVVLMSHVLEHCIDPHSAIRNICSIMEPGGLVVIEVPNNAAKGFMRFGANWPWTDIPRHINFFTCKSLKILLRSHGFEPSLVQYVGYFRQFSANWIKTQNDIWAAIGHGTKPDFRVAAWLLLARTAFSQPCRKYDSVRIHAVKNDVIQQPVPRLQPASKREPTWL